MSRARRKVDKKGGVRRLSGGELKESRYTFGAGSVQVKVMLLLDSGLRVKRGE